MSDAFVQLSDLTLSYGKSVAVPALDLSIRKGELIALLGPSGCGKTTTMRAIAGLLAPTSGRIHIDGRDVTKVPANKRGIGLVFQSYALFPHLSAFENVAFGLRLQKLPETEIRSRTEEGLATVGLTGFETRKPAEMSGGQQQRLALARSLVMRPKVLLLDEPLSNLDARLRLEMRTELQRVQKETGVTMVFVTHDQAEALALADRIVLMKQGKIEQLGTPSDLYAHPETAFAADFMGFENIFSVDGDRLTGTHGELALGYRPDSALLAWRPDGVTVGHGPHQGQVIASSFAGAHREYVIDSQIGQIKANAAISLPEVPIGERLAFDLPQDSARPLSA
ncbi:ABC transporter ATP-binding protein [Celeribacter indicus]|uniref:ABC transporter-like protein n=1 Tax=Celeribacter indicus TaxID=1208324 RepID=A0A0B5E677_9RHOB|nr:ABC transporter ATP-binding protein [Celeribacter indicus]AJE47842.1 ABC transporter-like protein [Celeribacter indicus]SDW24632.1 putative spermidine/putrescine transport system ATP-binding protein [Celeribacter indicus]